MKDVQRLSSVQAKQFLDQELSPLVTYVDPFAAPAKKKKKKTPWESALIASYAGARIRRSMEASTLAFLQFKPLRLRSIQEPGNAYPLTAECHWGRFHVLFFIDAGKPTLIVALARTPLFSFDLTSNALTYLTSYREGASAYDILRGILASLHRRYVKYEDLFGSGDDRRRALVIGDDRPTHFLRQSMGFIEAHQEQILAFMKKGGELWIVRDQCFVDPAQIFPELNQGRIVYTTIADAAAAFDWGPRFMRRAYRNSVDSMTWAQSFLGKAAAPRGDAAKPLKILISIDAEKNRFVNQVECLSAVLAEIGRTYGEIEIVWDGWTLKPFSTDARDEAMKLKIGEIVAQMAKPAALKAEFAAYGRPLGEKLSEIASCDLALCPHGTASLIPSRGYLIPTVTYHAQVCMEGRLEVDEKAFFPVEAGSIEEYAEQAKWPPDRRHFKVDPAGVLKAVSQAMSDRQKVPA